MELITNHMARTGMGSHQSTAMKNDEWLTPPEIIQALGEFDLDPCAPIIRPWDMAARHYTFADNGLLKSWGSAGTRVWLNPPYGANTKAWLNRLTDHGNGIALIFARTETDTFQRYVWEASDAVFFFFGRLYFHLVDGTRAKANAGAPSCLVAYGHENVRAIERSGLSGRLVRLRGT